MIHPHKTIGTLIAALLLAMPMTAGAGESGGAIHFRGAIVIPTESMRALHGPHPTAATAPLHVGRTPIGDADWTSDLLAYFADYALEEAEVVTASYH